jgi:hypothetical protein
MIMNRWRSFFVAGALLPVLVVFGSSVAFAQPTSPMARALDFDRVLLEWTATSTEDLDKVQVGYIAHKTAEDFDGLAPKTMLVDADADEVEIDGLTAGTRYVFGVRDHDPDADPPEDWVVAAASIVDTNDPPSPDNVDHRDVVIKEYDAALGVEWEDPLPGGTADDDLMIEKYMVQFSTKKTGGTWMSWPHDPMEPMVMITGLTNGTMYYVQIKAVNDAGGVSANWSTLVDGTPMAGGGSPTMPKPTPALPLFGALALGAGVLAAGRARLRRRREQRQLMTR